jgi:glycosyltransferase involved in cell wall biosynthesis
MRNEAERVRETVSALAPWLTADRDELVLVLDATSTDDTVPLGLAAAAEHRGVVRPQLVESRGKGNAIATGVAAAQGAVVLIADADLAVDPRSYGPLIAAAVNGALVIASRSAPGARRVGEPVSRYVVGRLFNLTVRALILPGVRDTQCGFKAFPRAPFVPIFAGMATEGWCFDVELIAHARRAGIDVVEMPVVWRYGHGSKVRLAGDAPSVVRDLVGLRRRFGRVRAAGATRRT